LIGPTKAAKRGKGEIPERRRGGFSAGQEYGDATRVLVPLVDDEDDFEVLSGHLLTLSSENRGGSGSLGISSVAMILVL